MIYESLSFVFCLIAIAAMHATMISSLMLGLAVVVKQRRPALAHAMLFGAALSLIALPIALVAFRNQAWQRFVVDSNSRTQLQSGLSKTILEQSVAKATNQNAGLAPLSAIDSRQRGTQHSVPSVSSEFDSIVDPNDAGLATIPNSLGEEPAIPSSKKFSDAGQASSTSSAVNKYFSQAWQPMLVVVWGIGFACFCLRLALAYVYMLLVSMRSVPAEEHVIRFTENLADQFEVRGPKVIVLKEVRQPMLWGVRKATIVLPEAHHSWSEQELIMILTHEMAHIQRGDHWSKIVNRFVLALYWFHPLVHWQYRLLESLAELSADDLSIVRGFKGIELSECLLKLVSSESGSTIALQFASFRELRIRLERLVSNQHSIYQVGKCGRMMQLALATIVPVVLSVCIGLGESQNVIAIQVRESLQTPLATELIDRAVAEMAKKPEWSHLPLDLNEQIKQQTIIGPEFNIQVRLLDQDKLPVAGTLCAIIENQTERANRRPFSRNDNPKMEPLPVSLGLTNDQGECVFDHIRGRHPSNAKNGIVQITLVVLHPEYGFRVMPLKRSNRMQSVTLEMESGKTLSGVVTNVDGSPLSDVTIDIGLTKQLDRFGNEESRFGRPSIVAPKVGTDENGAFVLEGLPPEHFVTLLPSRFAYEIADQSNPITTPNTSTGVGRIDIAMRRTEKQAMHFHCVDAKGTTTPPVPTAGYRPGSALEIDADGNYVTHAYQTYGNGTRFLRINLPTPWLSLDAVRHQGDFKEPFQVSLIRGRAVKGKVVDAVTTLPISGVPIFGREQISKDTLDERNRKAAPYQIWRTETQSNQLGEFELLISESDWSVMIDAPIFGYELDDPSVKNPNEFLDVLAGSESTPEFIFKLTPKKRIRGTLFGGDGMPLPGAEIACSYLSTELNETITTTNDKGEFELLPPPGQAKQYEISARSKTEESLLVLPSDWDKKTPSQLELRMKPRTQERVVEGRILVDGRGKSGVEVAISKGEKRTLFYGAGVVQRSGGGYVAHATTDANGDYRIVVPNSEHGQSEFHILAPSDLVTRWQIQHVDLDNKVNAGPKLEFITKPGKKTIRGKVQSAAGVPFEGATIYLSLADSNMRSTSADGNESRTVKTNELGEFEFSGLADTSYQLQAQSPTTNNLWHLVVRKICKAGETNVVMIMDRQFLEPPEKIVPQKR
jgi:beta-lactamase regulating signal transducer with metallopeptidase domain